MNFFRTGLALLVMTGTAAAATPLILPNPAGLPIPYPDVVLPSDTPHQAAYTNYLRTTAMFPAERVCEQFLAAKLTRLRPSDVLPNPYYLKRNDLGANLPEPVELVTTTWVTPAYMAWGGNQRDGMVVGPLSSLFTIIEAHITFKNAKGEIKPATLSCFTTYATASETQVWSQGKLNYGALLSKGHARYLTGPVEIMGSDLPGTPANWDKEIRYYAK